MRSLASFPGWSQLRDRALTGVGIGIGILLGWTILLSPVGVLIHVDAYQDYLREERLLACLQEARDRWVGQMCRYSFDKKLEHLHGD